MCLADDGVALRRALNRAAWRTENVKAICRIISSGIVYGIFAVGCVGSPATNDEPVETTEQSLANGYKDIIFFSEPELIIPVGECITASVCTAPSTVCSGSQTSFSTTTFHDCRF
jgi:hypothetical protein